jgi:hypothetical protein
MTTEKEVVALLKELENAGVFSRSAEGLIFCRRLVRDNASRIAGKETGSRGGNPALLGRRPEPANGMCLPTRLSDGLTPRVKAERREEKRDLDLEASSLCSAGGLDAKRTLSKTRTLIPPSWRPDAGGITYAQDRGVIVDQERPAFIKYYQDKCNLMADWPTAWRTWCGNQVKFGRAPGKPLGGEVPPLSAMAAAPAPDPWGIRAWTLRQPDVGSGTDQRTGLKHPAINGFIVEQSAEAVAEAAGLPEHWRGSWDALGAWLRADIDLTPAVFAAVTNQARRMRSQGQIISSIKVFDTAVRSAGERALA